MSRSEHRRRRPACDARHMSMKPLTLVGLVLVVLGLGALAYQGITYTTHETVLDIGPLRATTERQRTLSLPPLLAVMAAAGGVALLITGARKGKA